MSTKLALTITVPVVYMAWDIMILMWANSFQGPLVGSAPIIKTFFFWGGGGVEGVGLVHDQSLGMVHQNTGFGSCPFRKGVGKEGGMTGE